MEAEEYTRKRGGCRMAVWSIPSANRFGECGGFSTAPGHLQLARPSVNVEFQILQQEGLTGRGDFPFAGIF